MNQPLVCQLTLMKCLAGLAAAVWLTSANAQPTYTPIILDNPFPQPDAAFGGGVAAAGDVNGDGVPDLLMAAPGQNVDGNGAQGQAFVFSGTDGNLLLTLDDPSPQTAARFGRVIAGVGDVNSDGIPDLLVGAPNKTVEGNESQGQAFVFSGAGGSLLLTLDDPTPQANAAFGDAVAAVGDVNGDGIPDLLVGASLQGQGQAFVFSGADGSLLLTLDSPPSVAYFGAAVAGAGDVNVDGIPDLLVGAVVGGNFHQGQAFVFSGADGSLLLTLDDPTPQESAAFGAAVAGAGDVNVDGIPDLLVGATEQDVAGTGQGQAFVFSGADGSLLLTLDDPTPQPFARFGSAMAGAGDVNGDGIPDLLLGAGGQDVGGNDSQGQAFVFSGANGSLLLTLDNPMPQVSAPGSSDLGAFFGNAVAAVGDVNVDGIPDFLVGASGQNVAGNVDQGQAVLFVSSAGITHFLRCPGDTDDDGVSDLVVVDRSGVVTMRNVHGSGPSQFTLSGLGEVVDVAVVPDINTNGSPELAVLGEDGPLQVWDPMTHALLTTADLNAVVGLRDVETLSDISGDDVADLAVLAGHQAMLRDGVSGTALGSVSFSRYVQPVELLAPAQPAPGGSKLGILGENNQPTHADKLEFRDPASGNVTREIWLGKQWQVHQAELLADLNGNGADEWAVLRSDGGKVSVLIRDGASQAQLASIGFAQWIEPVHLETLPDVNGNNSPELVVIGRYQSSGAQPMEVKDAATRERIQRVWFDQSVPIQDAAQCPDINGNGSPEIGVVGQQASDGTVTVILKDPLTGQRVERITF